MWQLPDLTQIRLQCNINMPPSPTATKQQLDAIQYVEAGNGTMDTCSALILLTFKYLLQSYQVCGEIAPNQMETRPNMSALQCQLQLSGSLVIWALSMMKLDVTMLHCFMMRRLSTAGSYTRDFLRYCALFSCAFHISQPTVYSWLFSVYNRSDFKSTNPASASKRGEINT